MNEKMKVEEMEQRLGQYGHKEVWLAIEKITEPIERLKYRFLFFEAGGQLE